MAASCERAKGKPKTKTRTKMKTKSESETRPPVDTQVSWEESRAGSTSVRTAAAPMRYRDHSSSQEERSKDKQCHWKSGSLMQFMFKFIKPKECPKEDEDEAAGREMVADNPLIAIDLSCAGNEAELTTGENCQNLEQLDLGETKDKANVQRDATKRDLDATADSERPTTGVGTGGDVDNVKENFITLLRYNKLQCFYLGTLIYSVMNVGFIFYSTHWNSSLQVERVKLANEASEQQWLASDCGKALGADSQLQLGSNWAAIPFEPQLGRLLLVALAPLTLLLASIVAITTLELATKESRGSGSGGSGNSSMDTVGATRCAQNSNEFETNTSKSDASCEQHQSDAASCGREKTKDSIRTKERSSRVKRGAKLGLIQSAGLLLGLLLLHLPSLMLNLSPMFDWQLARRLQPAAGAAAQHQANASVGFRETVSARNSNNGNNINNNKLEQWRYQQRQPESSWRRMCLNGTPIGGLTLATNPFGRHVPTAPLLALVYLQPLILEGSPLSARHVCLLTMLPLFVFAPTRLWWLQSVASSKVAQINAIDIEHQRFFPQPNKQQQQQLDANNNNNSPQNQTTRTLATNNGTQNALSFATERQSWLANSQLALASNLTSILLIGLPLALLLALLKRHKFRQVLIKRTFAGANQLIDAKVSLENQRQHQETLLLSVLPAYVAEQVKRNMLKKTTPIIVHSSSSVLQPHIEQDHPPISSPVPHHNSTPCNVATSLVASGSGREGFKSSHPSVVTVPSQSNQLASNGGQSGTGGSTLLMSQASQPRSASLLSTSSRSTVGLTVATNTSAWTGPGGLGTNGAHKNSSHVTSLSPNHLTACGASSGPGSGSGSGSASPYVPAAVSPSAGGLSGPSRRGFNELYIRTYNNVSLLYGDIVGFTRLCTQLSSSQLVRVLNDLFSHFDHLAEKHKIMRIKILGDCYYGVSGIPEFAVMGAKSRASRHENHAVNCVNMGLDMIHYIRCLNVERASGGNCSPATSITGTQSGLNGAGGSAPVVCAKQCISHSLSATGMSVSGEEHGNSNRVFRLAPKCLPGEGESDRADQRCAGQCKSAGNCSPMPAFELNMRIGIHTGHIHSGVIGLKKWQFDVWSNDVSIAMHCESSGTAGRVQVTEATVQQLNGAFTYEKAHGPERDSFLASKDIRTYLIQDRVKQLLATGSTRTNNSELNRTRLGQEQDSKGGAGRQTRNVRTRMQLAHKSTSSGDNELVNSSSNSNSKYSDEDNIRAATIGTIRQSLLANENCNSSGGLNAYGLTLNHHDLKPLSLDYRDQTINKLYSNRPIEDLCCSLMILAALPLLIVPSIGSLLILPPHSDRTLVVISSIASILLLLLSFFGPRTTRTTKSLREESSKVTTTSGRKTTICSPQIEFGEIDSPPGGATAATAVASANARNSCQVIRAEQIDLNRSGAGRSIFACIGRPLASHLRLVSSCARAVALCLHLDNRRSRLRSFTTTLVFVSVILIQFYLLVGPFCGPQKNEKNSFGSNDDGKNGERGGEGESDKEFREKTYRTTTNAERALAKSEQFQLTVILMLISVDLSASLLGYKTRCAILISIICLQLINMFREFGHESTRLCLLMNFFEEIDSESGDGEKQQQQQHQSAARSSILNRQVIDWSSNALLLVMAFWSLAFARQLEYANRTNFLWRNRLNVDHEELEYISGINKVLLENILPSHVVQHYLTQAPNNEQTTSKILARTSASQAELSDGVLQRPYMRMRMSFSTMRNPDNELYHEQHDSVAVMFASIPHFYEFYDESDISKQGLGCIALLNEIICDFDKLLLKNKFSRIEKIKTIGSTYMAAAGLRPSFLTNTARNSNVSQQLHFNHSGNSGLNNQSPKQLVSQWKNSSQLGAALGSLANDNDDRRLIMSQQKLNLMCMVQFASSLMTALNGINKQSFQVFKLRIGVNTGPVIAGIIGAQRPFYDIWGDCVNIASRMESLGEVGRIQVEERTARLLMESLCADSYSIVRRGYIDVKGKGGMVTYFVDKKISCAPVTGVNEQGALNLTIDQQQIH